MISDNIKRLRHERGMTLEELARELGTTRQTIHRYENGTITNIPQEKIRLLAEKLGVTPAGLVGWEGSPMQFDNVMPIGKKSIPILGEIACGEPIYAEEMHESFCLTDEDTDADFCLRAHGDSMVGARIYDGDVVFIRMQSSVDNGEIAAVIIGEEATLKRVYYYPEEQKLVLSPENPRYAPLVYVGDELSAVRILGKAIAFQSRII